MKRKFDVLFLMTIVLSFCITGCVREPYASEDNDNMGNNTNKENPVDIDKGDVELEFWSWFGLGEDLKQQFYATTGIKVKETIFNFNECELEYMKAFASGEGPDVLMFDSSFFTQYTVNNILQDLLEEPYEAGKYKDQFLGWESGFSIDNKHLLALTFSTAPYVTFYRWDIMKEYGFPTEPEEFGEFIEKPENILEIASKLKQNDKYVFCYPTDMTDVAGATKGYFDDNLNFVRTGDLFGQALDIGKEAYKNSYMLGANFWNEEGRKVVQEDRLVMFFLGSYVMNTVEDYAPEQRGKWRIAKPPLDMAAWASDSRLAINAQSLHKEEAWKFLEYVVTHKYSGGYLESVVPGYLPVQNNTLNMGRKEQYFDDQIVYPIMLELATKMNHYKLTPMDAKATQIYRDVVWSAVQKEEDSYKAIEKMKEIINAELEEEMKILLDE